MFHREWNLLRGLLWKVTTSRSIVLPFSLMQLLMTHPIERRGHADLAVFRAKLAPPRWLSKLSFLENVHLVRGPAVSSPANTELTGVCLFSTSEFLLLLSPLFLIFGCLARYTGNPTRKSKLNTVQLLALCLFRNYKYLGKTVHWHPQTASWLSHYCPLCPE